MSSKYVLPARFIIQVITAIVLRDRRSFKKDALLALSGEHPPLKIIDKENIPQAGPCLILMNHYARPGYIPIWSGFAISSLLPMESHWLMTYAWTSPNKFWDTYERRLTRILFTSICRVYGFIPMPPMPPDPREITDRALAVRSLMALARQNLPIVIGMAPEGRDFPGAVLGWPPSGMGRLLEQLFKTISNVIPVGVYEANDQQVIHFGKPILLKIKEYSSNKEKDSDISRQVMQAIAYLLPEYLRGDFSSDNRK
jgi:1-acyl-sn-glycerol-3-phosphate acyltransferase